MIFNTETANNNNNAYYSNNNNNNNNYNTIGYGSASYKQNWSSNGQTDVAVIDWGSHW